MHGRFVLRHKLLGLFAVAVMLPGCASLGSFSWGWPGAQKAGSKEAEILFSHAAPPTQVQIASNEWSPTVWAQMPVAQAAEPLRNPSPPAEAPTSLPALTVYFDNDQDVLTPKELERLRTFVSQIDRGARTRFEITGHTDSNHTAEYNVGLSKRRAETVQRWMLQWGAPQDQVFLGWHGLQKPVSTNADEEGRARNRRVEIKLQPN
jgi:outer membrane protein OmpA-like peptidoglycan-associated protein